MSSMLKKTGGLAFKPKVGRRPGAASTSASASASQSTTRAPTAEPSQTPVPGLVPTPATASTTPAASIEPVTPQISSQPSQPAEQSQPQPQNQKQKQKQTDAPNEAPTPPTQSVRSAESITVTEERPITNAHTIASSAQNSVQSVVGIEATPVLTPVVTSESVVSTTAGASTSDAATRRPLPPPSNEAQIVAPVANDLVAKGAAVTAPVAGLPSPPATITSQSSIVPADVFPPPSQSPVSGEASTSTTPNPTQANDPPAVVTAAQPAKKRRQYQKRQPPAESLGGELAGAEATPKPKRARKRKTLTVAEGQEGEAATNVESATAAPKRRFRRRQATPDPDNIPEDGRPDHTTTKIGDLTRDLGIGKKFKHADLILERQRQARHEAKLRRLEKQKLAMGTLPPGEDEEVSRSGTPVVNDADTVAPGAQGPGIDFDIIDGQIMINQSSLVINQGAADGDVQLETVEEDEFTHLTTSASYMRPSRAIGTNHWDDEDTEKFYMYLKMFGTDFETISHMFPGRNRRQIKLKFNREEKQRPNRVNAAIMARGEKRVVIDLEHYKANRSGFNDHWITQDKFQAEQEQLRKEQEKELEIKRQERRDLGLLEDEPAKSKSDDKENVGDEQGEIEEELVDDQDVGGGTAAV